MAWASRSLLMGAGGGQSTACPPQSPGAGGTPARSPGGDKPLDTQGRTVAYERSWGASQALGGGALPAGSTSRWAGPLPPSTCSPAGLRLTLRPASDRRDLLSWITAHNGVFLPSHKVEQL